MRPLSLLLLLGLALPAHADDVNDTANRYASGLPLHTEGNAPFYRVELPFAVHTQARPDLADLRVFNQAGERLPHALGAWREPAAPVVAETRAVPWFPVPGTPARGFDGLQLDIRQQRDGRVIALHSRLPAHAATGVAGYLVDLSALATPVQAMQLDWPAGATVNTRARLDASDDLTHWVALAEGPLLDMRHDGRQLQLKRIAFAAGRHRYLRLATDMPLPALTAITAEVLPADSRMAPALRWHEVTARAGERPGEFRFDLGAHLEASRVAVVLAGDNRVAPVELLVKAREKDAWRPVLQGVAYRLDQNGRRIDSPAQAIAPTAGRYWLLRMDPRAGDAGSGLPVLRLGWTPRQLVFLARGTPPFLLAYGNRDAAPAQLPLASLLPAYTEGAETGLPAATPGTPVALGGRNAPAAGQEDRVPVDGKRLVLWGVLLLGVLALALMARSLLRESSPPA